MSGAQQHLKAADLSRSHLGQMVRVTQWTTQITGMLRGVSHEAVLIEERPIGVEVPHFHLGHTVTTLTFTQGGSIQVDGLADVEVVEL